MRYILCLSILPILLSAAEVDLPPKEEGLSELSVKMAEASEMLRQDRHDMLVKIKLNSIAEDLDGMIGKMEKQAQQQQEKQQKEQQKQKQAGKKKERPSNSPLQSSTLGAPTPSGPPQQEAAAVTRTGSKWANLPKAARDELLQVYADDMPLRWRKRLEAYYLSIAGEEVKKR